MKSIILSMLLVTGAVAKAELAKDCDSSCSAGIFSIETQRFPLRSFNESNRRAAIRYVEEVAQKSNSLLVKMRALEALNATVLAFITDTKIATLKSIKAIAAGSGDTTVEYKAIEMIGHALKSKDPEVALLSADLISQIASQSDQSFTRAVAENTLNQADINSHLQTMKSMIAIQPK